MKKLLAIIILFSTVARATDTTVVVKRISPVPSIVDNDADVKMDLNGSWFFNPAPEPGFEKSTAPNSAWSKIEVPGEWAMQGFKVEKNAWAGYTRSFTIPSDWKGKRIKLRCDAVYSESEIFVNGKRAGYHLGGFTPFEFDITDLVTAGAMSSISMKVKNEGIADSLASGSQYAVHPLGGITRKIYLMAVPEVNVSLFHVRTVFDSSFTNAVLKTEVQLANESNKELKNVELLFELFSPVTNELVFSKKVSLNNTIKTNSSDTKNFDFSVPQPKKWDTEHPNLYTYKLTLTANGSSEMVERKIGFRQVEVRGNKIFVNNMPIKVRGVCRHEVMPLRGRSLSPGQWEEDATIFMGANINYIRTSHYPPAEEFIHACDSLGIFLEVEAPFCWADGTNVPAALYQSAIVDQTLDMVNYFRSDPSIIVWSLANESQGAYTKYFKRSGELVKQLDPSRLRMYNQYGDEGDNGELEIENHHYPGAGGPAKYAYNARPVIFGEYAHLNAYNRLELVTDPGLRDAWGIGFKNMWEKMYAAGAVAGGAIWAGIDDTFVLPDGSVVGYGTWGPIDGWRRMKPEYWQIKKTYSPVKIQLAGNYQHNTVQLEIENRMLFSNVEECRIKWKAGKFNGAINPSIAAGSKQTVALKINGQLAANDTLFIDVYDPRNVLIDQYAFASVLQIKEAPEQKKPTLAFIRYDKGADKVTAKFSGMSVVLDKKTGEVTFIKGTGTESLFQLGQLMILPLNGEGRGTQMTGEKIDFPPLTNSCTNRIIKKIEFTCAYTVFTVKLIEEYAEASGYTIIECSASKKIKISYHYALNKDINPRQWGYVVSLNNSFNTTSWKRKGLWNYYPSDNIGRLQGTAKAFSNEPASGPAGPVAKPAVAWYQDVNALGTNDFRATKMNILEGKVIGRNATLTVVSDGTQHIRSWKESNTTKWLIAGYSNLGSEGFFRDHAAKFDTPLKQGNVIENTIQLEVE